jgi:hypothetical protein
MINPVAEFLEQKKNKILHKSKTRCLPLILRVQTSRKSDYSVRDSDNLCSNPEWFFIFNIDDRKRREMRSTNCICCGNYIDIKGYYWKNRIIPEKSIYRSPIYCDNLSHHQETYTSKWRNKAQTYISLYKLLYDQRNTDHHRDLLDQIYMCQMFIENPQLEIFYRIFCNYLGTSIFL